MLRGVTVNEVLEEAKKRNVFLVLHLSKAECFGASLSWEDARAVTLVVCPSYLNARVLVRPPGKEYTLPFSSVARAVLSDQLQRTVAVLLRKAFTAKGRKL